MVRAATRGDNSARFSPTASQSARLGPGRRFGGVASRSLQIALPCRQHPEIGEQLMTAQLTALDLLRHLKEGRPDLLGPRPVPGGDQSSAARRSSPRTPASRASSCAPNTATRRSVSGRASRCSSSSRRIAEAQPEQADSPVPLRGSRFWWPAATAPRLTRAAAPIPRHPAGPAAIRSSPRWRTLIQWTSAERR